MLPPVVNFSDEKPPPVGLGAALRAARHCLPPVLPIAATLVTVRACGDLPGRRGDVVDRSGVRGRRLHMTKVTGGCLCGAVRFDAPGPPLRVGVCHCMDCPKHRGALFQASAIHPRDSVTVTGQTQQYEGKHFCPRSGSSVFPARRVRSGCIWVPWMIRTNLFRLANSGPFGVHSGCPQSRVSHAITETG